MPKTKKAIIQDETEIPAASDASLPALDRDTADWFSDEQYDGQLAVDVYQTPEAIIVKSAIAGVEADDLDIAVHRDIVTIRGRRRKQDAIAKEDYLFQECYWGSFSRSIILPVEVDASGVAATLKNGILDITLPKAQSSGPQRIRVEADD